MILARFRDDFSHAVSDLKIKTGYIEAFISSGYGYVGREPSFVDIKDSKFYLLPNGVTIYENDERKSLIFVMDQEELVKFYRLQDLTGASPRLVQCFISMALAEVMDSKEKKIDIAYVEKISAVIIASFAAQIVFFQREYLSSTMMVVEFIVGLLAVCKGADILCKKAIREHTTELDCEAIGRYGFETVKKVLELTSKDRGSFNQRLADIKKYTKESCNMER